MFKTVKGELEQYSILSVDTMECLVNFLTATRQAALASVTDNTATNQLNDAAEQS